MSLVSLPGFLWYIDKISFVAMQRFQAQLGNVVFMKLWREDCLNRGKQWQGLHVLSMSHKSQGARKKACNSLGHLAILKQFSIPPKLQDPSLSLITYKKAKQQWAGSPSCSWTKHTSLDGIYYPLLMRLQCYVMLMVFSWLLCLTAITLRLRLTESTHNGRDVLA
jgi:hypothetical protein